MSVDHYENFPVASWLLPPAIRPAVVTIYRYARHADDLADEGDATPQARLAALRACRAALHARLQGQPLPEGPGQAELDALCTPLAAVMTRHGLSRVPFDNLLSAFEQDLTTHRYDSYAALLDYCRLSANPVGYLMLSLFGVGGPDALRESDAICTGLQLANFWQDVAIDLDKQRIYLPQEDLRRFGLDPARPETWATAAGWRPLMKFQVDRTRRLLKSGWPLTRRIPGRCGWELRLIVQGGLRILDRIEAADFDVFRHRPVLGKRDGLIVLWRALLNQI